MSEELRCKVLAVDDEPEILDSLSLFINSLGYDIVTQSDPTKVIRMIEKDSSINIIATDLMMPHLNGIELLKIIKSMYPDIQVIIITGYSNIDIVLSALKEGATDFIRKPIKIEYITSALEKAKKNIYSKYQLKKNYEEITYQNFELIKYRTLLEKKATQLVVHKHQLLKAKETIDQKNAELNQKVISQSQQIMEKEIAASYGELIQGITHNMNTPLATINGGLDLLKKRIIRDSEKGLYNTEKYINQINKISGATKNLIQIIKNTMNRSKDQNLPSCKELNLNKLLSQELEFLNANMFFKHKVTKIIDLKEYLPSFQAIYSDISQIILNLLQNAFDAMWNSPEKKLIIKTDFDNKNIYLTIQDSGSGIPKEILPKIFDIFVTTKPSQENKKTEEEPTGNGLGLHMVRRLAKSYDIEINVSSELNKGTQFLLKIPYNN